MQSLRADHRNRIGSHLLFGGKKIPELMRGLGRGVKEFKDAVNKDYTAEDNKPGDKSDSGKTE